MVLSHLKLKFSTLHTEAPSDYPEKHEITFHVGHSNQSSSTQKSTQGIQAYLKNMQLFCFKVFGQHQSNWKTYFKFPILNK